MLYPPHCKKKNIAAISYHNLKLNIRISNNVLFQLKIVSVHAWLKIVSLV